MRDRCAELRAQAYAKADAQRKEAAALRALEALISAQGPAQLRAALKGATEHAKAFPALFGDEVGAAKESLRALEVAEEHDRREARQLEALQKKWGEEAHRQRKEAAAAAARAKDTSCLLYTSPSPRDKRQSRMPSSA